jgi:hypothetical protein
MNYLANFGKLSKYDYERLKEQYNSQINNVPIIQRRQINYTQSGLEMNSNRNDHDRIKNIKDKLDNRDNKDSKENIKISNIKNEIILSNKNLHDELYSKNLKDDAVLNLNDDLLPKIQSHYKTNFNYEKINNENIFKNRKISDLRKDSKIDMNYNEMNNFNYDIIKNRNWGKNLYKKDGEICTTNKIFQVKNNKQSNKYINEGKGPRNRKKLNIY